MTIPNHLDTEQLVEFYDRFVGKLFNVMNTYEEARMHAAVGIAGEGGELLDIAKKGWVYGKQFTEEERQHWIEECGDVLFYLQAAAQLVGLQLTDLMINNMKKLEKRYPSGGFTGAEAIARADKDGSAN